MSPPRTVNAQKRFEFQASLAFFHKLDYLANHYSNGKRAQFIRDSVEFLYGNTSLLEASASTSKPDQGVLNA